MGPLAVVYHDVVDCEDWDSSGFPGIGPARYKLDWAQFDRHRELARPIVRNRPGRVADYLEGGAHGGGGGGSEIMLTFDDGGASGLRVGEALAVDGWTGHFFITTNLIGQDGFMKPDDIRALRDMGHSVGSHSASHPERMSRCSWAELENEWRTSIEVLSDILEGPVDIASVAGGYYSEVVARSAAACGIRALFTSEPTQRVRVVEGCHVFGRFMIRQATSPVTVRALLAGKAWPRAQQFASWNTKKVLKAVGGDSYLKVRKTLIGRG